MIPMCDNQEDRARACPGYAWGRGYPSDLTDVGWQVIAAPASRAARAAEPPRIWSPRRIVEAILYLDRTGCAWRYLPVDFLPRRPATATPPPGAMTAP
jgi:transposase